MLRLMVETSLIIPTGQGDDYITGCLLNYPYFKEKYKAIAIDLSKRQALDVDPRAIRQIKFNAVFFIIEEAKQTVLDLSKGTVKEL